MITVEKEKELKRFAADIRIGCMKQFGELGIGHVGGSMSICDLMACLYGGVMKINPQNPRWEQRDRFIMSKGHAGPAMYAALALKGYFDSNELLTLNKPGTNLPSHTDRNRTPGVDMTTGSLGQGFSSGLGIALGCKMKKLDNYVYILLGDGECQEGQVWECAMFAPAKKLTNVIVFIDYNKLQLDGSVEEISGVTDFKGKFREFGWQVIDVVDGNEVGEIMDAIEFAKEEKNQPTVIILNTKKGKGCFFAEDVFNHNVTVTKKQAEQVISQLEQYKATL